MQYILKQMSDERVANWSNTLAASREKKLRWKQERNEQEEQRRREIDAEEEARRKCERGEMIERARKLMYEEKDNVKLLRSRILYADVVASRRKQIEEKRLQQTEKEEEKRLSRLKLIQESQEAEMIEEEKKKASKALSHTIAKEMYRQIEEARTAQLNQEKEERQKESRYIQEIISSDANTLRQVSARKLEMKIRAMQENAKITEDTRHERDLRLMQEKEDSQRRGKELERQYLISNKRMELEKKHFDERQATRKLLSDRVCQDLQVRAQRELQFFIDGQKVKAIRDQNIAEDERKKRLSRQSEVDESRKLQVLLLKEKKERDAFEDLKIAEMQRQMVEISRDNVKNDVERIKLKNFEVRKSQEKQIQEKRNRAIEEREGVLQKDREVCPIDEPFSFSMFLFRKD
jgi:hypothetical protein